METILLALILLNLLHLIYDDFRSRMIDVRSVISLSLLATIWLYSKKGINAGMIKEISMSVVFLIFQFCLVFCYFSFRHKGTFRVVDVYIGKGDIIFIPIITCFFTFGNFIIFYSACLLITFLGYGFVKLLRSEIISIPLAGCIATGLFIILSSAFFAGFSTLDDSILYQWMLRL